MGSRAALDEGSAALAAVGASARAFTARHRIFRGCRVQEWIHHYGTPRVLAFGVTPEIYRLRWPKGTNFLAVDHTQAMIGAVWPKTVQCTEWLALSLPKNSRDILSDNGMCIFRLYVPPTAGVAGHG
jgi:hypothetical protein